MKTASVQSTAATIPGTKYSLYVLNSSASPVNLVMTWDDGNSYVNMTDGDTTSNAAVAAGEKRTFTFYAHGTGIDLGTTSASVTWSLVPVQ